MIVRKRKLYLHQSSTLAVLGGTLDMEHVDNGMDTDTARIPPFLMMGGGGI